MFRGKWYSDLVLLILAIIFVGIIFLGSVQWANGNWSISASDIFYIEDWLTIVDIR